MVIRSIMVIYLIFSSLKGLGTSGIFFTILHKGDTFCDFLFAFLHPETHLKQIYSERKEFATKGIYSERKEFAPKGSTLKGETLFPQRSTLNGKNLLLKGSTLKGEKLG